MRFHGLLNTLTSDPALRRTLDDVHLPGVTALDLSAAPAYFPIVGAAIAAQGRTVLAVTSTYREAEQLSAELGTWLGEDEVAYYPAWETLPHERLSPRADTVGRRLAALRRLASDRPPKAVVAPVRSLLQPQVKGLSGMRPVTVGVGESYELSELTSALVGAAYTRVDLVERRGEFAVRGGLLDVFPPTAEHPVRIDFFGDEVEEIRTFHVADQRSTGETWPAVVAAPCRELLLTDEVRARAARLADQHPELGDMLGRLAEGQAVEGMEALIPALVDGLELLVDVLPKESVVLSVAPELVRTRAAELVNTSREFLDASWAAAAGGGTSPIDLGASAYWELADVRQHALAIGHRWWQLTPFTADDDYSADGAHQRRLSAAATGTFRGNSDAAVEHLRQRTGDGWAVLLVVEGKGLAQRLLEMTTESGLGATIIEAGQAPQPGMVSIAVGAVRSGWVNDAARVELITTAELTGQQVSDRAERKLPARRKNRIEPLELKKGDLVVHETHGVGRFVESAQRVVHGAARDYLVIEYAPSKRGQPGDRLFVPMDQLDQLSRYVGAESPALDKMGGADWSKRKARARAAVREISAELIKLYAARQATKGHAFAPDTDWQRELEDAFSHVETPDQLSAIEEVKRDMESPVPMDRLICGDVGYGKTEIAVRAAFKAVQDGKQVAVLVPTTLLVGQHYQTFASRFAGFPVRVAELSRFQTDAQARRVIEEVASGKVDVIIGTHRLLGKEVEFKDLGLVIIDEEQRFGVEHKERLKSMRLNVDVLTMSATPIPRTLETAITGIREMSVIATPPEERHPVLTFAGRYDDGQVRAAIRRELAREGQVFYVHNRVSTIEKTAAHLRELVPEARIITAHGQMSEKRLEQVIQDFWERRADVLVATTIVEAGLNIQSANTLIIDRADNLGLSQMHQLRGRVGRSRERGYAYFLYPADKTLSETSHERLATMAANTDLGAGMAIAMRDLELRGAGNLLGEDQSGHIEGVGFDLYLRMVGEAVAAYKGDAPQEEPTMRIDIPVDANIPESYISSERLRLQMYKQIAQIRSSADIDVVRAELIDRYGAVPQQVEALLGVAHLRNLARAAGIEEIVPAGKWVRFAPVDLPESRKLRLARLYPGSAVKPGLIQVPKPEGGYLAWATTLVGQIFG
ncbi:transcription-repair coupling factor [Tessaracoccus sp. OH4464_COT-324]|uniref:transcription-repair coupling factor n=1 Tax=Tessaracoccus sp. OH4464_COT-324 TaxID=2491059 RepID=UPI000F63528D|nr:transcription-repair coupling factor [Tessaracoccus sp. OH4464_COT-324]RRD45253.1 transcription-repair coupling factor [Tessaracoccus sp. OH4464_COT-324]